MGEQRGSNVQGCKREKGVTARKYGLVHTSADQVGMHHFPSAHSVRENEYFQQEKSILR